MNHTGFLEKLLDGVDIKWRELGDVGSFQRGKRFVKKDLVAEGVPCIHYGEMYTRYGIWTDVAYSFIDSARSEGLRVANPGDVIIVAAGETVEDIGNGTAWLGDDNVIIHDACFSYKSKLNPKYVSYYLRTKFFKGQIKKYVSSGKISAINSTGLSKAKIPIPCPDSPEKSLDIQAQIVCALDSLTELETKLETVLRTELNSRKKQYDYYRNQLFDFDDDAMIMYVKNMLSGCEVQWKSFGELGEFIRGNGLQKKDFVDDGFPAIHYGQLHTKYSLAAERTYVHVSHDLAKKLRIARKNDLLLATTSENDEDVVKPLAWLGEKAAISGDMMIFRHNQNVRYLAYYVQSELFQSQKRRHIIGTKVRRVSSGSLAKIKIPIPCPDNPEKSLIIQANIVRILDKFDTLTNSISEGLPREIELRRKQYRYYCDLLYSFPKPEEAKN